MTAIQLVSGYNGMGVHSFLQIQSSFPGLYHNFVFVSVALVDQGIMKNGESVADLTKDVDVALARYVELARRYGFWAEGRSAAGTNVQDAAIELCRKLRNEFPRCTVFTGNLIFKRERFVHRLLHNESAFAIQRRLQWDDITNVVLPVRVKRASDNVQYRKIKSHTRISYKEVDGTSIN